MRWGCNLSIYKYTHIYFLLIGKWVCVWILLLLVIMRTIILEWIQCIYCVCVCEWIKVINTVLWYRLMHTHNQATCLISIKVNNFGNEDNKNSIVFIFIFTDKSRVESVVSYGLWINFIITTCKRVLLTFFFTWNFRLKHTHTQSIYQLT